jgi:uncharacterized FAD-dependent dehydrogenase
MKEIQFVVAPEIGFDEMLLEQYIRKQLRVPNSVSIAIRLLNRSMDARSKNIKVNVKAMVAIENEVLPPLFNYQIAQLPDVSKAKQAIIVGAGPAGLFAALRLIELGVKPIVLERGKDVRGRRHDLAALNKKQTVNPESNYCFGEGGAGTYSDGKLYTRSDKRGNVRRILEIMVAHGANPAILYESRPHIGTNKLPPLIAAIRNTILEKGGEVHFDTKVIDLLIKNNRIQGVVTENQQNWYGIGTILATGHSARDIFYLLNKKNIYIEAKPFALGVRVEHPQPLIDKIQYHCEVRSEYLPASYYSLVSQVKQGKDQRGVFSFCMCPGGFIVPAATAQGEVVVNGMSPSRRNSPFANSGIVVSVDERDFLPYKKEGALAGLYYQQAIEQQACRIAGGTLVAPAQRLTDFTQQKVSTTLNDCSYQPGLASVSMYEVLPKSISHFLKNAFIDFGKKMKGYLTNEAQIIGVESRTSSPVRIPRDTETYMHPEIAGLFPCGEGAGYAGGIMSAAIDGEKCAEQLVKNC